MNITLNGSPHQTTGPETVSHLLSSLGLAGKPVVVELNEEAIFPRDYDQIEILDGSRVEVVTLAAGG